MGNRKENSLVCGRFLLLWSLCGGIFLQELNPAEFLDVDVLFVAFSESGDKLESEGPAKYSSAAGAVETTRVQEEFPLIPNFIHV